MKKIILVLLVFMVQPSFAQDTTAIKMKEWLGVLTLTEKYKDEKNWLQQDQVIVSDHFKRLVKFKNEGVVVLAGRTQLATNDPDMQGLVIFYAKDDKEALQFMMDDPAVKNNIMQFKLHPYSIALNKCD